MSDELPITHQIADGIVRLTYVGEIEVDDIVDSRMAFLADPKYEPGMSFLVDLTRASLTKLRGNSLKRVGDHGRSIDAQLGRMAHAATELATKPSGRC